MSLTQSLGEEDDDILILPADTLALVQSFYAARDENLSQLASLKSISHSSILALDDDNAPPPHSIDLFAEDWNASQFWYTDATATSLAAQLLENTTPASCIAVISAPSVYVQLMNLLAGVRQADRPKICLLEYDTRFEVLDGWVRYDFEKPLQLPAEMGGSFDRILCDPPFHSRDCLEEFAKTVSYLSKPSQSSSSSGPERPSSRLSPPTQVIFCTGEDQATTISEMDTWPRLRATTFRVEHQQGRLKSRYACYANFECGIWDWREDGEGKEEG